MTDSTSSVSLPNQDNLIQIIKKMQGDIDDLKRALQYPIDTYKVKTGRDYAAGDFFAGTATSYNFPQASYHSAWPGFDWTDDASHKLFLAWMDTPGSTGGLISSSRPINKNVGELVIYAPPGVNMSDPLFSWISLGR